MSTTTDMRDAYLAAELDILQHGRTTSIEGRTLTTADLPEIIAGRKEWERRAIAEARAANSPGLPHSLVNLTQR